MTNFDSISFDSTPVGICIFFFFLGLETYKYTSKESDVAHQLTGYFTISFYLYNLGQLE